jgi:hypothetical protein
MCYCIGYESLQKKSYRWLNAAIKAVYETVIGDLMPPGLFAKIDKTGSSQEKQWTEKCSGSHGLAGEGRI